MKTHRLTTALLLTTTTLVGCGERKAPDAAATLTPIGAAAGESAPSDERANLHAALRQRLLALDYYASRMWALDQPGAPQAWLEASAAEHGVALAGVMPEPMAVAESVATRRLGVRAEGEWEALLGWLAAIEDSPRRFVARDITLHRLRGRSVADLQLTALMDRPAALQAMGELNLSSMDTAGLAGVIERLDADLRQKGETLDRLGADVSWARPIAAVTENLPDAGTLIRLHLGRGALDARAQRFEGSFTAQVHHAGDVDPMVAALNTTEGFARAELTGGRDVGAGFRRAEVAFTYGQPAEAEPAAEEVGAPVADDPGAGLRRNPFRGPEVRAAAAPRPRVVGNVLLDAPRVAGRRAGPRTASVPRGPRTVPTTRFTSTSGFTNPSRFTQSSGFTNTAAFTNPSGFADSSRLTNATTSGRSTRFRFDVSRGAATPVGPRNALKTALRRFHFDATR